MKILAKIQTLKANQKLQGWIYQIARNTIIDYFRTRKSAGELPESLSAPADEQSDQALQEKGKIIDYEQKGDDCKSC